MKDCVAKGRNNPPWLGKTMPKEMTDAMSARNRGEGNPNFGKHHSEATKALIGAATSGDNNGSRKASLAGEHWNAVISPDAKCLIMFHLFAGIGSQKTLGAVFGGITQSAVYKINKQIAGARLSDTVDTHCGVTREELEALPAKLTLYKRVGY